MFCCPPTADSPVTISSTTYSFLEFAPTSRGHRKPFWKSICTIEVHKSRRGEVAPSEKANGSPSRWHRFLQCIKGPGDVYCRVTAKRGWNFALEDNNDTSDTEAFLCNTVLVNQYAYSSFLSHAPRDPSRLQRSRKEAFRQQPDRSNMEWRFSNQWQ